MLAVPPPSVYEVVGPSTIAAEGPSFPLPAPGLPVPPAMIEDLGTRLGNLEYGHRQLMQRVNQVSDAEVAAGITIGELGPMIYAVEGQGQQTAVQREEMIAELTQQVQCDNRDLSRLKWFTYMHDVILEVNDYLILCAYEFSVKFSICSHVVIMEMKDVLHALLCQFLVFKS
ncbi:hypothetical protein Tco_0842825 [Tanacetum coccineum]|uniref:Uncharacterized protein n=1 Tax=Tanacetum coccineum TaxID=301880 RepID=A0ABQ5B1K0_9ASTR